MDLVELLNNAMGFIEDRATLDQVESAVEGISEKYSTEFYAFELKQSGGGWQFLTKKEYHKTVAQLNGDKFLKRLSTAALETLAIIAYKQPITKSEIESIRGVNCDYAVQKLLEKDLVIIAGRNEEAVGKPLIYATSKSFMDYFGINSTDDLPKINEVLMEEMVQATIMNPTVEPEGETGTSVIDEVAIDVAGLVVTESGEIIEDIQELSTNGFSEQVEEEPAPQLGEDNVATEESTAGEEDTPAPEKAAEEKQVKDDEDHSES